MVSIKSIEYKWLKFALDYERYKNTAKSGNRQERFY